LLPPDHSIGGIGSAMGAAFFREPVFRLAPAFFFAADFFLAPPFFFAAALFFGAAFRFAAAFFFFGPAFRFAAAFFLPAFFAARMASATARTCSVVVSSLLT
jgi:hypothetical protein